jgi:hypothetical protein
MSSSAQVRVRPRVEVESHRPSLRLVAAQSLTASRLPFAIFVGSILVIGLVALLLLHTLAAQDAFRLESLQHESAQMSDTQQQLALAEQQRDAPTALAARARALGMVPTGSIAFVELHRHGKIVGVVQAVPSPPPPAPSPTASPSASPNASATPSASAKPNASAQPRTTASATATTAATQSASPHRSGTHHRSGTGPRRVTQPTRR